MDGWLQFVVINTGWRYRLLDASITICGREKDSNCVAYLLCRSTMLSCCFLTSKRLDAQGLCELLFHPPPRFGRTRSDVLRIDYGVQIA